MVNIEAISLLSRQFNRLMISATQAIRPSLPLAQFAAVGSR
jgi:hypothetical protein